MTCQHEGTLETIACNTCMGDTEAEYRAYQDANSVGIGELAWIVISVLTLALLAYPGGGS